MHDALGLRVSEALARFIGLVCRFPRSVLLLCLLLTVVAGYVTVERIGINTSTTDMLSPELPFRRHDSEIKAALPRDPSRIVVVVEAAAGDAAARGAEALYEELRNAPGPMARVFYAPRDPFFERHGLLYLEQSELADTIDRLAEAQPLLIALKDDPSLRGLAEVLRLAVEEGGAEAAALATALAEMAEVAAANAEGQSKHLSWQSLLKGESETLAPGDVAREILLVEVQQDFNSLQPAAEAVRQIRAAAAALDVTTAEGISVRLTGSPVLFHEELKSVERGLEWVGLASFILVGVILTLGLGSWQLVVATLATLAGGLAWTAGFATLAVGELNLISVAFAVLFIGIGVDFAIHFALRFREELRQRDPKAALVEATLRVGGVLSLCGVTTAIAFFSFLPTSYRGFSELGLISGVGMFIALAATFTLLPAILVILPRPAPGKAKNAPTGGIPSRIHARGVLFAALLIAIFSTLALPWVRFDDDPLNLRDPQSESVETLRDLITDPQVTPYDARVLVAGADEAEAVKAQLEALPEVKEVRGIADFLPGNQDEKLLQIEDAALFLAPLVLPSEEAPNLDEAGRAKVAEEMIELLRSAGPELQPEAERLAGALEKAAGDPARLLAVERSLIGDLPRELERLALALEAGPVGIDELPHHITDGYVTRDDRRLLRIFPKAAMDSGDAREAFVDAVLSKAPKATGGAVTIVEAGRAVLLAFEEAATYAIIAVTLILLVLLRRLKDTLLVLAPLALAALVTLAFTVLASQPFNFANVIVLPLLFGLGMDSGIHLVTRNRESGTSAMLESSTPRAVVLAALTTLASFASLSFSAHRGTASMGLLLTAAILATLVATIIVLPALVEVMSGRGSRNDRSSGR